MTDKLQRLHTADNAQKTNSSKETSGAKMTNIAVKAIPLALYIHIPWCVKKCPYCDFNSHELPTDSPLSMSETYEDYVDALLADALLQQPLAQGRKLSSIFIGGGTPSLLPIPQYQRLFEGLRHYFDFADNIEITMEANPGTLEHAPFTEYLQVGINRLSIGVQSFSADKLTTLGRIHDPQQAVTAIKAAREAGFRRVNVDLMHGLPQQSLVEALHDIQLAHDTGATHISWYQLTIEPNTVFYRNQPVLPDEDNLADIEEAGGALLHSLGYSNYEVSAWAGRLDAPCRHNLNYWQFGDYLAIGAGAHGKVSIDLLTAENDTKKKISTLVSSIDNASLEPENDTAPIYRYSKSRLPKDYLNYKNQSNDNHANNENSNRQNNIATMPAPKMVGWSAIASDELVSEFMLNALRLHDGVTWQLFEARTGMSYKDVADSVERLVAKGLLTESTEKLQTTALGRRYLNQILRAFL